MRVFARATLITLPLILVALQPHYQSSQPSYLALLPPLITIVAAFILREVISALFFGLIVGAWIVNGGSLSGLLNGFVSLPSEWVLQALADGDNLKIILLTLFIGGMMSVVYRSGGMQGLVAHIGRWATNRRRGQLSTALLGLVIFFDDFANTLVVGNTMRPLTDKLKISRAKLAYLVDSTAAPIASVAVISLWVGFQVGLIESAIDGIHALNNGFILFLHSIAYSFYPWLALYFVFAIIYSGRDFGPMLVAERKSQQIQIAQATVTSTAKSSAWYATLPIAVLIITVVATLFYTGEGSDLPARLGSADAFLALLLGGFLGSLSAIALVVCGRVQTLQAAIDAWISGLNDVTTGIIILVLSWSMADMTQALNTATYLVALLGDQLPYQLYPACVFITAAIVAFGTGSSWGTMAILVPLTIPLSWQLIDADPARLYIVYASVSAVLAGAVWGDHCSPLSDTSILSSMASQCPHMEHVRTQMPYALSVGLVAILAGLIPVGFGIPWWLCMIAGALCLALLLRLVGRPV